MKNQLFATLLSLSLVGTPVWGQTSDKESQDVQKEKGWSGLPMPSWAFLSIGEFIR